MTKTTNYGLPQWEGSDRVLRTDFNEAMADIDAALQANADAIDAEEAARAAAVTELSNRSRFTKLQEVTVSTIGTKQIEMDLTNLDWAHWNKLHLDMIAPSSSTFTMYLNQATNTGNNYKTFLSGGDTMYGAQMTFEVGFLPNRQVLIQQRGEWYAGQFPFSQLTKLYFIANSIAVGAHFVLWGEV